MERGDIYLVTLDPPAAIIDEVLAKLAPLFD